MTDSLSSSQRRRRHDLVLPAYCRCFRVPALVVPSLTRLPQLINELGFTPLASQGLTVAPYAAGWFMVIFQALHSDRTRDRGYHIMLSTAVSCVGYIVLAALATRGTSTSTIGGRYFALFLVVGGNYSLFPLVMSWAANVFSPTSKRSVGTAFIVSISNCVSTCLHCSGWRTAAAAGRRLSAECEGDAPDASSTLGCSGGGIGTAGVPGWL